MGTSAAVLWTALFINLQILALRLMPVLTQSEDAFLTLHLRRTIMMGA